MRNSVTVDSAGRVVLPKDLRDEIHLSPGDTLDLTVQDDAVTLRARRSPTPLQRSAAFGCSAPALPSRPRKPA